MSDVKWIKITTDIFDDEKILLIESLPDADAIIVIWFKLLCLAGKTNNSGVFILNDIAYTDKMLSTIFRRKESTVQLALETFRKFGMIDILDGVITIPNWGKHQNLDEMERRKEYMRNYMTEYRDKQKGIACKTNGKVNSKVNSKVNVNCAEGEGEEDVDREGEERESREKAPVSKNIMIPRETQEEIKQAWNSLGLDQVREISKKREKALQELIAKYGLDGIHEAIEKVRKAPFLKGEVKEDFRASFDWFLKSDNFLKTLEGAYDEGKGKKKKEDLINDTSGYGEINGMYDGFADSIGRKAE